MQNFSLKFLHMKITKIIITLNILVFLLWIQMGNQHAKFMMDNFLISWDTLRAGRYWALIASAFSHNMLWHLFLNMFVFLNFGIIVEQTLGSMRFLLFYLFASVASSFSHAFICAYVLHQPELLDRKSVWRRLRCYPSLCTLLSTTQSVFFWFYSSSRNLGSYHHKQLRFVRIN